jgi:hypothetical protein
MRTIENRQLHSLYPTMYIAQHVFQYGSPVFFVSRIVALPIANVHTVSSLFLVRTLKWTSEVVSIKTPKKTKKAIVADPNPGSCAFLTGSGSGVHGCFFRTPDILFLNHSKNIIVKN